VASGLAMGRGGGWHAGPVVGCPAEMFASPNGLQCYAGKAPVTRRSGKSELVVSTRLACNGHLRDAVQQWAFCSLLYSGRVREFYDGQVA